MTLPCAKRFYQKAFSTKARDPSHCMTTRHFYKIARREGNTHYDTGATHVMPPAKSLKAFLIKLVARRCGATHAVAPGVFFSILA